MVYSDGKHEARLQSSDSWCILSWARTLLRVINQGEEEGILAWLNLNVVAYDKAWIKQTGAWMLCITFKKDQF